MLIFWLTPWQEWRCTEETLEPLTLGIRLLKQCTPRNRNRISSWEKEKAKCCPAQSRGTCLSWLYPRALQEELKPRQGYPSWAGPHLGMSCFLFRTLALCLNINLCKDPEIFFERPWLSLFLFPVWSYWINHAFLSFTITLANLFVTYFSFSRQGQCTLDWPEPVT